MAKRTKPKTIRIERLSRIHMVSGGEKNLIKNGGRVIKDGRVLNWVGFGWVDEGKVTAKDLTLYPTVVGHEPIAKRKRGRPHAEKGDKVPAVQAKVRAKS